MELDFEEICCSCQHLYYFGLYPRSIPICDVTDDYYIGSLNIKMGMSSGIIVSCSDYRKIPPNWLLSTIHDIRYKKDG